MSFYFYKTILFSIRRVMLLAFVWMPICISAQNSKESEVNLDKIPPRIVRACCAFGYDLKLWGVPFINIDQVISVDDLDEHHYMGHKHEGVGTIYTHKGGFIDMGHLRDQIDWTRYLYTTIVNNRGKGELILRLGNEAGRKTLRLNIPSQFNNDDCILLAGKITYDLSLWHEISTWFGASTIPLMPEKFSSFSLEDVYSNLLGVYLGMEALQSELPFNEAATKAIAATLDSLAAVKTAKETYDAYDAVHDIWFTNKKRIPRSTITLKRDVDVLHSVRPWIVPNNKNTVGEPIVLEVPLLNTKGKSLTEFYEFYIDLNSKIPVDEIFPNRKSRVVNQNDFGVLLNRVKNDLATINQESSVEKE